MISLCSYLTAASDCLGTTNIILISHHHSRQYKSPAEKVEDMFALLGKGKGRQIEFNLIREIHRCYYFNNSPKAIISLMVHCSQLI